MARSTIWSSSCLLSCHQTSAATRRTCRLRARYNCPSSTNRSPTGPSFEELQKELEDIVARLERGDVAVDDAIALFRKGEKLYKTCVERLQGAELRIEELAVTDDE